MLPNVVKINVEIDDVDSTLVIVFVLSFNVDIHKAA